MTRDEAETMIRASTAHDADTQVTTAQIQAWLLQAYYRLRKLIASVAPALYSARSATQDLTSSDPDFDPPADMVRPLRFEMLQGTEYVGVSIASPIHPDLSGRGWRFEATKIRVFPARNATGTYRLVYVVKPTVTGNYVIEVPDGLEEMLVEAVAARCRVRLNEDSSVHLAAVDAMWKDVKSDIRRQHGNHTECGFVPTTGW